jgi:hypothetical protein
MDAHDETPLGGGHLSAVVRAGNTVRRPTGPWTPAVHALLKHLEAAGYDGAPRVLGVDELGREVLSFIPGEVAVGNNPPAYVWTHETLIAIARLLRRYHDAAASFAPPADAVWRTADLPPERSEVICHSDIAPWNTIFQSGSPVAFIDWDQASPGLRIWDVAYTLWHFVPLYDDEKCAQFGCEASLDVRAQRVRGFCDAYALPPTRAVLGAVIERQRRARNRIRSLAEAGDPAYQRLWQSGVREDIFRASRFVERNSPALARYLTVEP